MCCGQCAFEEMDIYIKPILWLKLLLHVPHLENYLKQKCTQTQQILELY